MYIKKSAAQAKLFRHWSIMGWCCKNL